MGFFGGNNEDDDTNKLIEEQIMQNNQQIEQDRKALADRRLEIIKSQGAQNWQPGQLPRPPGGRQARMPLDGSKGGRH
jgi:hypothetical protein